LAALSFAMPRDDSRELYMGSANVVSHHHG
jgi:hypothetical protein